MERDFDYDFDQLDVDEIMQMFESAVGSIMKARRATGRPVDRRASVMACASKFPRLHQAFLKASNNNQKACRLVDEKYSSMPEAPRERSRR